MLQRKQHVKETKEKEQKFHRGQTVIYQGEEARVLDVEPVMTIKIKNSNCIVCGNTLQDDLSLNNVY